VRIHPDMRYGTVHLPRDRDTVRRRVRGHLDESAALRWLQHSLHQLVRGWGLPGKLQRWEEERAGDRHRLRRRRVSEVRNIQGCGKDSDCASNLCAAGKCSGGFTTLAFAAAVNYPMIGNTMPWSVALADLNVDGKLDVATANNNSNNASVALGAGTGALGAFTNFAAGRCRSTCSRTT